MMTKFCKDCKYCSGFHFVGGYEFSKCSNPSVHGITGNEIDVVSGNKKRFNHMYCEILRKYNRCDPDIHFEQKESFWKRIFK